MFVVLSTRPLGCRNFEVSGLCGDGECDDEQTPLEFLVSPRAQRLDGDFGYVWTAEHA